MILPLFPRVRYVPAFPEDLERTVAQCHPLLKGNRVAVSAKRGWRTTTVKVVAEVSRRLQRLRELDLAGGENPLVEEVKAAIRNAVFQAHGVRVETIALVPRHSIPQRADRTTEHRACCGAFSQ